MTNYYAEVNYTKTSPIKVYNMKKIRFYAKLRFSFSGVRAHLNGLGKKKSSFMIISIKICVENILKMRI